MAKRDVNKVIIVGNLTKDPDLRNTGAGTSVCELRIANNVNVKKDGNWDTKVNFFQVNVWGPQGENCEKYLSKGSRILIEGRLDWQMWEKDGQTNSRVLIQADRVDFLSMKPKENGAKSEGETEKAEEPAPDDIPF